MDVNKELKKLGEEEKKLAKWVNYFIDEIKKLKSEIKDLKEKNEILGRSVLTLFDKK